MSWDELSLQRWIGRSLRARPMDDAARLGEGLRRPVVCADQLIVGVHVEAQGAPATWGRKACARALSDLAASAAQPRSVLCTLRAPPSAEESQLRALLRGVEREALRHGAELVGGDLACAPGPLGVSVTALGEGDRRHAPGRGGARPGDVLVATGPMGGSRLGRHLRIVPRLQEGRWLARAGARAMMDVSDGLAIDATRLARASGVRIDLEAVPIHRDAKRAARADGRSPLWHALNDGEDHELIAALPARTWTRLESEAKHICPSLTRIGSVQRGRGVRASLEPGGALRVLAQRGGWVHGHA